MGIVINYIIKTKKWNDFFGKEAEEISLHLIDKAMSIQEKFKDRIENIGIGLIKGVGGGFGVQFYIEENTILDLPFIANHSENCFICDNFIKTNLAENFIKAHVTAVEILESFKGDDFDVEIDDGARYYETKDIVHLTQHKEMYDLMGRNFRYALCQVGFNGIIEEGVNVDIDDLNKLSTINPNKKELKQIEQAIILTNQLNEMCGIKARMKMIDDVKNSNEFDDSIKKFYKSRPKFNKQAYEKFLRDEEEKDK